ncbi:thiamine-phosphate kinase [Alicyclobacillus mengziensis]|uniref:Thiamine-monophosphate kinase n=1 Tax=Alicyclobacillus mengziensis TaxID=2931921 RepID=A0A9X7W0A1_9BACL|nr:thiamine-phosphate kinase [Alicyclobacillus mengziensis]QSO46988.1 thiamine-phosphate kinase [Alicyclobacillus mengziensis]
MKLDEFGLIRTLTARVPVTGPHVVLGPGDDAAVLEALPDERVLATSDTMVQGPHFLPETMAPFDVGYKAVAASISDIAAMGGEPRHVLIALGIPSSIEVDFMESIYDGVGQICREYQCTVVGGDVVRTDGPLFINTTVLGATSRPPLKRSGAQPGNLVFVTGYVGSAAAGLDVLRSSSITAKEDAAFLTAAHQRPKPQVAAGQIFSLEGATSCDDISDGLASELNEIANASNVRMRIQTQRIPIHTAVRNLARVRGTDTLDYAFYGGEDYQLVGTASPFQFARILARCESIGISVQQIGRVEAGDGVVAEFPDGRLDVISAKGYNHFAE